MSIFDSLFGEYGGDLAIDLGTANTLVAVRGQGIVINEPSVVAIDKSESRVLAVGADAKRMIGRTPGSIIAERPLKDGVIADFDVTEVMLRYFIEKARERKYPWSPRPRVVVCVPSGVTSVEKRAVFEATIQAGARQAFLIEEPMAAAIGADLPIEDPTGSMVVDIGGGTTEVAVISMGGIVVSQSIRTAGDEFDQTILEHVRDAYNLSIGERTAEDIKIKVGSAAPLAEELDVEVNGRDVMSGLPKTVRIESEEIRRALDRPLDEVTEKARERKYPWSPRPRVVVCVPSGVTSVEKRAVFEATIQAGARQAFLIEEPMAAAIGADLPIEDPTGSMVVDIGGGTTEVAVISMGGIVVSQSIRTAGDEFDQTILEHVRDAYNLSIGERTAEDIKIKVGSAAPLAEELDVEHCRL